MEVLNEGDFPLWDAFVTEHSFPESFLQSSLWPAEKFFIVAETATAQTNAKSTQTNANKIIIGGCKVEERGLWMGRNMWLVRRPVNSQQLTINKIFEYLIEKAKEQRNVVMIRIQLPITNYQLPITRPRLLFHIKDPKMTLLVDLRFSEEELLSEMHGKTRYNIRLAEKKGVGVREGSLDEFYLLYEATNRRKGLKGFSREYFSSLPLKIRGTKGVMSDSESITPLTPLTLRGGKEGLSCLVFTAYFENTPLASNFLVCFGKTVTYLFGGTSDEHRELMAPHLLHWECLRWAKRNGYHWYDWWGIEKQSTVNSQQSTRNQDWTGITRFKQGFVSQKTGRVVDFGETQDSVILKSWYRIFSFLKKIV